jgi:hypothetical protein
MTWFEGGPLPTPTDERFAQEMRAASSRWEGRGILPEQTSAWENLGFMEITLVELGPNDVIAIHASVMPTGDGFEGVADWSFDGYVLDGARMKVTDTSFDSVARAVIELLDTELGRPLIREEWNRRRKEPAVQWSLDNPREVWRRDGFSFARLFGRPADRSERVR